MNPLNLNKTHTTKFILPMVFDEYTKYDKILTPHFENTYIAIYDKPEFDDHIIITYNMQQDPENLPKYKETYDNNYNFFFIYEIPNEWADNFVLVLNGEYSELSEKYKQHLLNFWDANSKSKLHSVLYKDKSAIKNRELELEKNLNFSRIDELWPPPNINSEIYGLGAE